jgi:sugar lactone lactonase YvrE
LDGAGSICVSTQSSTGVLVYSADGRLLRGVATAYPEIHSIVFATEGGEEYLYTTVQKGNPQANWRFLKI